SKNTITHPGKIVIQAMQKQCMKVQKVEDEAKEHNKLNAKEAAAIKGLEHLAGMQKEMEEAKEHAATARPKGIRPQPCPFKQK
ncbi:hypothetical protein PAXRUDRAFT_51747, partial [Paxillus rubicundulus Ve08.2h10]